MVSNPDTRDVLVLKKEVNMKMFNFLILASSITADSVYAGTTISIEEAAKKGLVKLVIKGKGGYTGDVIEMKISNLSAQSLNLKVEAGRRLDSKNNGEQDLLVTKAQDIFLAAKQERSFNVAGMCCQAHNSAPKVSSDYLVGSMADSNLIKLATFIDKNKYYSNYTAQEAVWVISDDNSLASITSGTKDDVTKIRAYVSQLTGKEIPAYNITYKQQDERSVLGRATKIEGIFSYSMNIDNKVTIGIFDNSGKMVQLIFEKHPHERGDYKLYYVFNTHNLPEGKYYARLLMDGAVLKEEKIEF